MSLLFLFCLTKIKNICCLCLYANLGIVTFVPSFYLPYKDCCAMCISRKNKNCRLFPLIVLSTHESFKKVVFSWRSSLESCRCSVFSFVCSTKIKTKLLPCLFVDFFLLFFLFFLFYSFGLLYLIFVVVINQLCA